jgi:hypothetical protein
MMARVEGKVPARADSAPGIRAAERMTIAREKATAATTRNGDDWADARAERINSACGRARFRDLDGADAATVATGRVGVIDGSHTAR